MSLIFAGTTCQPRTTTLVTFAEEGNRLSDYAIVRRNRFFDMQYAGLGDERTRGILGPNDRFPSRDQ